MKQLEEVLYLVSGEDDEPGFDPAPYSELPEQDQRYYERLAAAARAYTLVRKKCTPGEAVDALLAGRPVWRDGELFPTYDFSTCDVEITFYPDDVWEIGV